MEVKFDVDEFTHAGLGFSEAKELSQSLAQEIKKFSSKELFWNTVSKKNLRTYPFSIHLIVFNILFPDWKEKPYLAPAVIPDDETISHANLTKVMSQLNMQAYTDFHAWSTQSYARFWELVLQLLNIQFKSFPKEICDLGKGIENPLWFKEGKLNIVDSCFNADPKKTAIIYQAIDKTIQCITYGELDVLSNRIANSLVKLGFKAKDAIAIVMPMNFQAVSIYLGIIKMGASVVSIADSFSTHEIEIRLSISNAKLIFTQDENLWGNKKIPLYEKIKPLSNDKMVKAIVLAYERLKVELNSGDITWEDFLIENSEFTSVTCLPQDTCNILFSSGTTGTPKAIPWNHTTPIKVASDAFFHQNIKPNDILTWPTNLGWMMGPWVLFAAFINQATLALYTDVPKDKSFGEFIQNTNVTMLGVVPTLVATWKQSKCMEGLDWNKIKVFSSTGECSNAEDMLYLMSLANYKPVIEYCGGTEIGGAYVTSTVIQTNYPSLFSTKAMGMDFIILDEEGQLSNLGEVAIKPPSLGLSTTLLNANHHDIYFANMPTKNQILLRRHGDQIIQYPNAYYCVLGRVDDTMNLGGIKVSAVEIERVLNGLDSINEVAAIAINSVINRTTSLIIYAATTSTKDKTNIIREMQKRINEQLNPLFKIHDVVFTKQLPKTASNKIMRRVLRDEYLKNITP